MMFRPRHAGLIKSLGAIFWPKKGFLRGWMYLLMRILRSRLSDYSLAAGFAVGVAMSFTPFIGLHVLLTVLVASWVKGNIIMAIIGTIIGNPWTFPLIWVFIYWVGVQILGTGASSDVDVSAFSLNYLLESPGIVLVSMMLGGAVAGLIIGTIVFGLAYVFAGRIKAVLSKISRRIKTRKKVKA